MKNLKKYFALSMIVFIVLCNGCAHKGSSQNFQVKYYPTCHEPLAYLREEHTGAAGKAVAKGAIQGGLITGISSFIIGLITGRLEPTTVLATTAAGAAVGATAAAFNSDYESREDNKQMAKYLEQIEGDISEINNVTDAAATLAMQCYKKNFTTLKSAMSEGKISVSAARERFNEILAGTEAAASLLETIPDTETMKKEFESAALEDPDK